MKGVMLMLDDFDNVLFFGDNPKKGIMSVTKSENLQKLFSIIANAVYEETNQHQIASCMKFEAIMFAIFNGLSLRYPDVYRTSDFLQLFDKAHDNLKPEDIKSSKITGKDEDTAQ